MRIGITMMVIALVFVACTVALPTLAPTKLDQTTSRATVAPVQVTAPSTAVSRSGQVDIDLGTRPFDFGSQGQARELLALIERQPGKNGYSITYRTTADVVVFGCDFAKDVLIRVHREPTGRGKGETWDGYILERLRSGAAVGSLNDTPAGKRFAREASF